MNKHIETVLVNLEKIRIYLSEKHIKRINTYLSGKLFTKKDNIQVPEQPQTDNAAQEGETENPDEPEESNNYVYIEREKFEELIQILEAIADLNEQQEKEIVEYGEHTNNIVKRIIEVANNAEEENSMVESTCSELDQIAGSIKDITLSTDSIIEKINQSFNRVNDGYNQMNDIISQIGKISEKIMSLSEMFEVLRKLTAKVQNINKTISFLSSQVKLVSLNATIQSAIAGEKGRGFSVVANEIKNISYKSSMNTKQIFSIVDEITHTINHINTEFKKSVDDVQTNLESINESKVVFNIMMESMEELLKNTGNIKKYSENVNNNSKSIIDSLEDIKVKVEENTKNTVDVSKLADAQTGNIVDMIALCQQTCDLITVVKSTSDELGKNINN